jgi:hypothetical protein
VGDRVDERTEPVDAGAYDVPGFEVKAASGADPGRGAGRDDVARLRVVMRLAAEISSATVQIMSWVDSSCCSSSFTQSRSRRFCGSGTRKSGVTPGPRGRDPSMALEPNQSYRNASAGTSSVPRRWCPRAVTSFATQ